MLQFAVVAFCGLVAWIGIIEKRLWLDRPGLYGGGYPENKQIPSVCQHNKQMSLHELFIREELSVGWNKPNSLNGFSHLHALPIHYNIPKPAIF
jgi:hypothetical protein